MLTQLVNWLQANYPQLATKQDGDLLEITGGYENATFIQLREIHGVVYDAIGERSLGTDFDSVIDTLLEWGYFDLV